MRKYFCATSLLCLIITTPALAQTTTATGVGISGAESNSGALAVANNRGNGNSNSSLTVNNPANQTISSTVSGTTTSNVNQTVSGSTTSRLVSSGTTTVRTAPSMVAPGLAAAGLETCLGSASGTVSAIGFGIGGGSTYADEGCQARLDSRTLFAYGLKSAAVARLCQRAQVWNSMPDVCERYWPVGMPVPQGVVFVQRGPNITMSADGGGGSIRVIDGRDGVEKDCINYSATKQKCYQWAGEPIRRSMARTAAVNPTEQPKRIVAKPKPKPTPAAVAAPEAPKAPEPPKVDEKKS